MCDVSRAHQGEVVFWLAEARVENVMRLLAECRLRPHPFAAQGPRPLGWMTAKEAESLHGKLGFATTALFGRVGRASLQPLVQRAHRPERWVWTEAMSHMTGFLSTVFASPLLRKSVRLEQSSAPHVLVNTDASFALGPRGQRGLGVVVWDAATNRRFYSSRLCPDGIIARHFQNADHIICQLEMLAALAAYLTFPDVLAGRRVLHFIDNTAALSALVHGYSSAADMAQMSTMFHLRVASLRADVWLEYVPTVANIADIPSRPGTLSASRHPDWWMLDALQWSRAACGCRRRTSGIPSVPCCASRPPSRWGHGESVGEGRAQGGVGVA